MPSISDLKDKKVVVLGFGQEGQATADYLISNGITPEIYDGKGMSSWKTSAIAKIKHLSLNAYCAADFIDKAIVNSDVIFRSPGVRISQEQRESANKKNLLITSQTQWFFEHSPAKIIGITGTKGKGTTSSLIYEMLNNEAGNQKIYLTGNIGKIQPFEFIDKLSTNDLVVYELSSFQLQDLSQSPHVGVCLMITSDHLDYHKDLAEYYKAKSSIAAFQGPEDILVYNNDYKATQQLAALGAGQKWPISKTTLSITPRILISEQEEQIEVISSEQDHVVLETSSRLLKGKHNLENIAAASAVAVALKIPVQKIQNVITSFKGLKHRLQFVADKEGVEYYNDSVSTNPDTTIAAIRAFDKPIVLIVGGAVKNLDYTSLVKEINDSKQIKCVVTMGPAGQIISESLKQTNVAKPTQGPFSNFKEVITTAKRIASKGDIVLLSPGATSFDMFNSYSERGDEFIKLVMD